MAHDEGGGDGRLIPFPGGSDPSYVPPPTIPTYTDDSASPGDPAPPEEDTETTMELPPIPRIPAPESALASDGIPDTGYSDGESEGEDDGEYVQRRSLADRIGDWIEFRMERVRVQQECEQPFREAEIARKAALLEARTKNDVAMMEQNGKLQQALVKARGDKAAARGKASADRTSTSGASFGADKGRSKHSRSSSGMGGRNGSSGGSGRHHPGSHRSNGPGRGGGTGRGQHGGSGHGPGRRGSGTGGGKGSERSSGGRNGGSRHPGATKGSKGSQAGADGSGRGGAKGPSKPDRPWRDRNGKGKPLTGVSPWKDKPGSKPNGASGGAAKDKPETKTGPKAGTSTAAKNAPGRGGRLPAGTVLDPHKPGARHWKDRQGSGANKPGTGGNRGTEAPKGAPGAASTGRNGGAAPGGPGVAPKSGGASGSSDKKSGAPRSGSGPSAGGPSMGDRVKGGWRKAKERRSEASSGPQEPAGTVPADSVGITVTRVDQPHRHDHTDQADDSGGPASPRRGTSRPPAGVTTGARGLPRAPEPHTKRPGTTRPAKETGTTPPTAKEGSVSQPEVRTTARMPAQHRTDITFGEYLVSMTNIAVAAEFDKDEAEALAEKLGKVADGLRAMADDLAGDHNIDAKVTDMITDLADGAGRMKAQAIRCAEACGTASEAATTAAFGVARVYGQDMDAKEQAGLKHVSAAAHHD